MIKNTPLEYTQDEFNAFVEKHNYEVFSAETVNAFCKDLLEKSKKNEIDEFEKSCAAADFVSLTPAIIVGNDLVKRTVYYRENQTEEVEIPDGIFKSINDKMCRKFKETSLNILKGIAGINCADEDAIEKAKALPIGTEKTYGGKLYVKTEKGWRPKVKGTGKKEDLDNKLSMISKKQQQIKEFKEKLDKLDKESTAIYKEYENFSGPVEEEKKLEEKYYAAFHERQALRKKIDRLNQEVERLRMSDEEIQEKKDKREQSKQDRSYTNEVLDAIDYNAKFIDRQAHSYRINIGGMDKKEFNKLKKDVESKFPGTKVRVTSGTGMTVIDVPFSKTDKDKKESEKEELDEDGELVTVTHDKDKFERYRLFRDLYAARMKKGTSPKLAKEGYLKNSGDVNKKGNEKYYELLKEFGDKKYTYSEKQPKKNKFAREIEEARKIGEQLRKEHEQRVASGQKIGSDDPRDRSKLIGFNKK